MVDEREILATRLKAFRKEHKINQLAFAEECGLNKDTVSLIERRKENVTIDTIQLLAARMGLTVADLFNRSTVTYFVLPGKVEIEDEIFTTYGIGVLKDNAMIDCIEDISDDYNAIKSLVLMCNEEELELIHLMDVAEDALF